MSSHPSVSRPMLVTVLSCSVSPGTRPGGSASTSRERDHHAPSSVPARDRVVSGLSRTETGLADSRNRSGRNAGNDVSQSSAMARHPSARPGRAHSPGGTSPRTPGIRTTPVSPPYSDRSSHSPARPGRGREPSSRRDPCRSAPTGPATTLLRPVACRLGASESERRRVIERLATVVGECSAEARYWVCGTAFEHRPAGHLDGGRPESGAAAEGAPHRSPCPTPPGRREGGRSRRAWWWPGREGDGWCGRGPYRIAGAGTASAPSRGRVTSRGQRPA